MGERGRQLELLVTAVAAALCAACGAAVPAPVPRVLASAPTGVVPPDAVSAEITFSAALAADGIADGRFFALCRREDLRDVLRAAESPGGIAAGVPVVPARVALLDGGTRAVLQPVQPLEADTPWAVLLSYRARAADGRPFVDVDGKAQSVVLLFETGPVADRVPPHGRWVVPPHGPVPANVSGLRVAFDEPVTGALALPAGAAGRAWSAVSDGPELLGLDSASPLAPGDLALDLSGIRDAAGNPAAPLDPIGVSACRAEAPPPLAGDSRVSADRLAIVIQGATRGMGRLLAEVSAMPGEPACGVAPPPPASLIVRGDVAPCPGWDPCQPGAVACPAAVTVTGLCPGRTVRLRIGAEDLAGHRGGWGAALDAAALPPAPVPVVTEVLADADAPEAGGEYVEVANVGTGDLDLAGFALAKRTATGKLVRCTVEATAAARVPPGGHALVVGGSYDRRYAIGADAVLYRCGATALAGGLPNDRPVALALEREGAIVSSAGMAEEPERCTQGALERVHPDGPDVASNWACPGTITPGACNRSTPPAECPRRPW
jgi:hypothetical protein